MMAKPALKLLLYIYSWMNVVLFSALWWLLCVIEYLHDSLQL